MNSQASVFNSRACASEIQELSLRKAQDKTVCFCTFLLCFKLICCSIGIFLWQHCILTNKHFIQKILKLENVSLFFGGTITGLWTVFPTNCCWSIGFPAWNRCVALPLIPTANSWQARTFYRLDMSQNILEFIECVDSLTQ